MQCVALFHGRRRFFFFFMEVRAVSTRQGPVWVIVDDKASVWLACESFWAVCGYSSSTKLVTALQNVQDVEGSLLKKRSGFPVVVLDASPCRIDQWFARAHSVGAALVKRFASHRRESDGWSTLLEGVSSFVAGKVVALRQKTVVLESALKAVGTLTRSQSLAGMRPNALVSETFFRPKKKLTLLDVPAPSTIESPRAKIFRKRVAAESPASAPRLRSSEKRLAAGEVAVRVLDFASDEEVDFGSPFVPTGARKSLPEFAANGVFAGGQRRMMTENDKQSTDLNDRLYQSALLDLPRVMPVVGALEVEAEWTGSSARSSAVIREIVSSAGHRLVNTGTGKHVYFLYIGAAGLADAELQALIHFKRVHLVKMVRSGCGLKLWNLKSGSYGQAEMAVLAEHLFVRELARRPVPNNQNTPECISMAAQFPHLQQTIGHRETSLNETSSVTTGFFVGPDRLALIRIDSVVRDNREIPCSVCKHAGISDPVPIFRGQCLTLRFTCAGCKSQFSKNYGTEELNKTLFVASQMTGDASACNRFLATVGVGKGKISHASNGIDWTPRLFVSSKPVYQVNVQQSLAYFMLQKDAALAVDGFYKRIAKHATMGIAPFMAISQIDLSTGACLGMGWYNRHEAHAGRINGVYQRASEFNDLKSVQTEMVQMECAALQLTSQELVLRFGDNFFLKTICSDALSSAEKTFKQYLGPEVKVFIDWWHKRKSFNKLLRKLCQGKKSEKVGRSKPSKYPMFENLIDSIGPIFSDFLFHGKLFEEFEHEARASCLGHGIDLGALDESHMTAFNNLMANAKDIFESVVPAMNTQANEALHAHGRFWWSKHVAYSYDHWRALVCFQVLSWNNYPNWRNLVLQNFLQSFRINT
jgi:hypothetical protein